MWAGATVELLFSRARFCAAEMTFSAASAVGCDSVQSRHQTSLEALDVSATGDLHSLNFQFAAIRNGVRLCERVVR